jgi:hypothetical protein
MSPDISSALSCKDDRGSDSASKRCSLLSASTIFSSCVETSLLSVSAMNLQCNVKNEHIDFHLFIYYKKCSVKVPPYSSVEFPLDAIAFDMICVLMDVLSCCVKKKYYIRA